MKTLVFELAYDGGSFMGYQRQAGRAADTVQGFLEEMLGEILAEPVEAICAGRTDTGVHASGQVVHVRTQSPLDAARVAQALNRKAHGRLAIVGAWHVANWFHARHNASRRTYQYHLLTSDAPSPWLRGLTWHVPWKLDLSLMQAEASSLLGRRDFRAYQASRGDELRHFFRTLYRFDVGPVEATLNGSWLASLPAGGGLVMAQIEADAFLPHMVRMLMGTLVAIGSGRRPTGTAAAVLRSRDPQQCSPLAPPQGLCLVRVVYSAGLPTTPTYTDI
jgi:tRNA pseudouridine38-40 synthase